MKSIASFLLLVSVALPCSAGTAHDKAIAAVAVAIAQVDAVNETPVLPDTTNRFFHAIHQMSVTYAKTAVVSEVLPAQLIISVWEKGCIPCVQLEKEILKTLKPLGWSIGDGVENQIQFVHVSHDQSVPHIELLQNGSVIKEWDGRQDVGMLSFELRKAWDESPAIRSYSSTSAVGAINGRAQISQAIQWFRQYVGEGVKAEMRWDRSGAQSFPLLAKGDWSATALFGGYGHMQFSASGAKNLPIESLGFGYRVSGDDITFDIDPLTFQGLASQLGPSANQPAELKTATSVPSQFGLMTIWTIATVVRDIWSILHPSCDLQLGGNVTATAVLEGDMLAVDFQQAPSIKLIALFTFNLSVKRVEITEESVRLIFSGSRLVKERTFSVE